MQVERAWVKRQEMERLLIEETIYTPRVDFSPSRSRLLLAGVSRPENTVEFYRPVLEWLESFVNEMVKRQAKGESITLVFDMDYFNSISAKYIIAIIFKCKPLQAEGVSLRVEWHYYENDQEGQEWGEDIASIVGLDFAMCNKQGKNSVWD